MSATIQHHPSPKIDLVHYSMDEEEVLRALKDDQKGAHEDYTCKLTLFNDLFVPLPSLLSRFFLKSLHIMCACAHSAKE